MANPTSKLRVQAGTQTDYVTAATPTVALRGIEELTLRPANDVEILGDLAQGLAGGDTPIVKGIGAAGSFSGWASYQHIAYWFDNLFGQATPSGTAPTVTRAYAAPVTSVPSPRFLSLVYGVDGTGSYQMVGSLLSNLTLRFEQRAALQISGDLTGVKLQTDTLETLTSPTVSPIHAAQLGDFKMDTFSGTMGTTAVNNCFIRFAEFTFNPGREARSCFGTISMDDYIDMPWESTLQLGLEFNSTTIAMVNDIIGGTLTRRQIEMTATGPSGRTLTLQYAGTVTDDIDIFSDDDGAVTVDVTFERTYHTTFGNWFKATLINELATLT